MKNMSQQARAGAKGGQVSQANGYGHRWLRDEEGVLVAAKGRAAQASKRSANSKGPNMARKKRLTYDDSVGKEY